MDRAEKMVYRIVYYSALLRGGLGSAISSSPAADTAAAHSSRREAIQKKVMDWPISSQDPVS